MKTKSIGWSVGLVLPVLWWCSVGVGLVRKGVLVSKRRPIVCSGPSRKKRGARGQVKHTTPTKGWLAGRSGPRASNATIDRGTRVLLDSCKAQSQPKEAGAPRRAPVPKALLAPVRTPLCGHRPVVKGLQQRLRETRTSQKEMAAFAKAPARHRSLPPRPHARTPSHNAARPPDGTRAPTRHTRQPLLSRPRAASGHYAQLKGGPQMLARLARPPPSCRPLPANRPPPRRPIIPRPLAQSCACQEGQVPSACGKVGATRARAAAEDNPHARAPFVLDRVVSMTRRERAAAAALLAPRKMPRQIVCGPTNRARHTKNESGRMRNH